MEKTNRYLNGIGLGASVVFASSAAIGLTAVAAGPETIAPHVSALANKAFLASWATAFVSVVLPSNSDIQFKPAHSDKKTACATIALLAAFTFTGTQPAPPDVGAMKANPDRLGIPAKEFAARNVVGQTRVSPAPREVDITDMMCPSPLALL